MEYYWIRRRWFDFRNGHATYLIFLLAFGNFVLIFYRLLIEQVSIFEVIFPSLWIFALVFILVYIPAAILIGAWHRKTQLRVETDLMFVQYPFLARSFGILMDLAEGKASKEDIQNFRNFLRSIEMGTYAKKKKKKDKSNSEKT